MQQQFLMGLDQMLFLFSLIFLIAFVSWVIFFRKGSKSAASAASAAMFFISLLILWRVFKLNLDFGLVLSVATIFAGMSWILGIYLSFSSLKEVIKTIPGSKEKISKMKKDSSIFEKLKNLQPEKIEKEREKNILKYFNTLKEESKSYFWILLLILSIRSFAYEPYQIPSSSMEPGLQVGDFVLVNKFSYGLKLPALNKAINRGSSPKRGDVAVFLPPHTLCNTKPEDARPELSSLPLKESQIFLGKFISLQKSRCSKLGMKYVKRVIGVPGDKVTIKGYELYINGEKIEQVIKKRNGNEAIFIETIEEKEHLIRILGISEYESFSWTIPQDRFLVLGDNRDNSLDSRAWGYFSKENLIGKAEFIWLHWALFSEMPSFNRNKRIQ